MERIFDLESESKDSQIQGETAISTIAGVITDRKDVETDSDASDTSAAGSANRSSSDKQVTSTEPEKSYGLHRIGPQLLAFYRNLLNLRLLF